MVRLQLKLRYDYAKLKARGQLRNRTRYASATPVAASFDTVMQRKLLPPSTIDEKRSRSMNDPFHDVQKHPRRIGNPAEGLSHTPSSSPTPSTLATSPDTDIGHNNDVVFLVSPHRTGSSLAP